VINYFASRKIDELGRIVLPIELRRLLDWDTADSIAVILNEENNFVTLRLSEKHHGSKCTFCGATEEAIKFNDKGICNNCLAKIKET